ncbi:MAG TPA: PilN domain-containing protein [Lysobacter sp.]|nr:PilN domain-containing protein [Lysobacter sp.]
MTALRERLGVQSLRAGGFFSWWGRSLGAWLPRSWRSALGLDRGRLLLGSDGDGLQLRLQDGDGLRDLGRMPLPAELEVEGNDVLAAVLSPSMAELPRWLLLPAGCCLRRRLVLPAAAAERLRDVVGFEIDRQTPFAAEDAAYDARLLSRRDGDGQLDVELVVVPRAVLDAQRNALGAQARLLAGADVAGANGEPLGVNLLPPALRFAHSDPWRAWNLVLAVVAVVALAAALWQMLDNRRTAADAFAVVADRQADAARDVSVQRQRLVDLVQGQAFLDRSRGGRATTVEVLDELSRRLPDDTYLEKLAVEGDRITLIGLSNQASALVGRLEGSKLWRAPALTGALVPDPRTHRDRFTLVIELVDTGPGAEDGGDDANRH